MKSGLCKSVALFWVRSCPASVSRLFTSAVQSLFDTMVLVNDSNSQLSPGTGGGGQCTTVMPQEPWIWRASMTWKLAGNAELRSPIPPEWDSTFE